MTLFLKKIFSFTSFLFSGLMLLLCGLQNTVVLWQQIECMLIVIFVCVCVCVLAAIHEFPEDIFTKEQRKNGAVILHALCVSWTHNICASMKTSFILLNQG